MLSSACAVVSSDSLKAKYSAYATDAFLPMLPVPNVLLVIRGSASVSRKWCSSFCSSAKVYCS